MMNSNIIVIQLLTLSNKKANWFKYHRLCCKGNQSYLWECHIFYLRVPYSLSYWSACRNGD